MADADTRARPPLNTRTATGFVSMLSLLLNSLSVELPDAPHSSAEWKIAAYSSAAPAPLSAGCGVMEGTTVLRASTNGWTCLAANPRQMPEEGWPSAHVAMPLCTDSEGLRFECLALDSRSFC